MSMEKNQNNQRAYGNVNSKVTIVNGDYNSMNESQITDLCLKLINDKLNQLREDAYEVLKMQVTSFSKDLFQRISFIEGKVDLLQKFASPSIQFALGESIMGYSQRDSDEHKELLIELLLKRLQVEDVSLKAILLDKLRKEIPYLTQNSVDMLAFLVSNMLEFKSNNKAELRNDLKELNPILESASQMSSLDFYYLQHTDFVHRISFVEKADFIERTFASTYKMLIGDESLESLRSFLKDVNPLWIEFLDLIKKYSMACYTPSAMGVYLGLIRLGQVLNQDFDYDNYLSQLS